MDIGELASYLILDGVGLFTLYLVFCLLDFYARSRWAKVGAGTAILAFVVFACWHIASLCPGVGSRYFYDWAIRTAFVSVVIGYMGYRSSRLLVAGLRMPRITYTFTPRGDYVEVRIRGVELADLEKVEIGRAYVFSYPAFSYASRPTAQVGVNFYLEGELRYEAAMGVGDWVVVRVPAVEGYMSGFTSLGGFILEARCIKICLRGNALYLCPPPSGYTIELEKDELEVGTPEGWARARLSESHGSLVVRLDAELRGARAKVLVVRANSALGTRCEEVLLNVAESGGYTAVWKPKVPRDWLTFTEDELPFKKLKLEKRGSCRACADLTGPVNELYLELRVEKRHGRAEDRSRLVVRPGRVWKVRVY